MTYHAGHTFRRSDHRRLINQSRGSRFDLEPSGTAADYRNLRPGPWNRTPGSLLYDLRHKQPTENTLLEPHLAIPAVNQQTAAETVRFFGDLEINTYAYLTVGNEWKIALSHAYLRPYMPAPYNAVLAGFKFLSSDGAFIRQYVETARALRSGMKALQEAGTIDSYVMRNTQREFALLVATDAFVIEALQAGLPADYRSEHDMQEHLMRLGVSAACMPEVTTSIHHTLQKLLHEPAPARQTQTGLSAANDSAHL